MVGGIFREVKTRLEGGVAKLEGSCGEGGRNEWVGMYEGDLMEREGWGRWNEGLGWGCGGGVRELRGR